MFNEKKYMASLNKARRKRNQNPYITYILIALAIIAAISLLTIIGFFIKNQVTAHSEKVAAQESLEAIEASIAAEEAAQQASEAAAVAAQAESRAAEEAVQAAQAAEKQAIIDAYTDIGIVHLDGGYLNVRKTPESNGDIVGKMQPDAVCDILDQQGDWYHISSGEVEGYIASEFVLTGEEARTKALDQVKLRAIVKLEKGALNIRKDPSIGDNIVGQALNNEKYEVISQLDGWIQIPSGYISSDYAEVKLAVGEAVKMDLKAMAVDRYDNILISKVTNYLNVRSTPEDKGDSNIIGKMPSNAAGEVLETLDGWYKIRSGNVTGYVSADYTAVGQEAIDLAMNAASLMAIVNVDGLRVRKEPNTNCGIWTNLSKNERYAVIEQLDGWVQIDLDAGDGDGDKAYISTRENNVEVRYALQEAIKFSPLEETANKQSSLRNKIVNFAVKYVGNPYVWGGTSLTNGADCSGFVQSVLRNFGISVPRVSRDQANAGRGIKSSEMRPGDLVFYTNSSGTINHVAMYIGNGQVVHAASRRSGIKISSWNYRTPAKIRNVID